MNVIVRGMAGHTSSSQATNSNVVEAAANNTNVRLGQCREDVAPDVAWSDRGNTFVLGQSHSLHVRKGDGDTTLNAGGASEGCMATALGSKWTLRKTS